MDNRLDTANLESNKIDRLAASAGIFLGLCSIFEPYIVFQVSGLTIRVTDVALILLAMLVVLRNRNKTLIINLSRFSLLIWYVGFAFITLFGIMVSNSGFANTYRSVFINMIYIILFELVWRVASFESFKKTLYIAGTIVSLVVVLQFVLGNIGIPMWDGRIPGFQIYGHWSAYNKLIIRDIRPNGVFQEASYVGLYLMIALAAALKDTKYKYVITFTVALLLSASLVSIGGVAIAYIYLFIFSKESKMNEKAKRRAFIILLILIITFVVLYSNNQSVKSTIDYLVGRINGMGESLRGERMSSERYRLTGYIDYFFQYNSAQKAFGVGESQYYLFFGLEKGYANNFVTCLLNFGIVGLIWYILGQISLFRKIDISKRIYFWLFVFVSAVDAFWFNWHFFYAITPCMLLNNNVNGNREENF